VAHHGSDTEDPYSTVEGIEKLFEALKELGIVEVDTAAAYLHTVTRPGFFEE
jgi:hypothetical protein